MKFILKLTGALALAAVIASCSKEEDATSQSQGYSKAGVKTTTRVDRNKGFRRSNNSSE